MAGGELREVGGSKNFVMSPLPSPVQWAVYAAVDSISLNVMTLLMLTEPK